MKSLKLFFVLLLVTFSSISFAQVDAKIEMFEIGIQTGVGLAWSNRQPVEGVSRSFQNGWFTEWNIPAMETFGGMLRCNIDERWSVQAQAMAQRLMFFETVNEHTYSYYNNMCNVDITTEFNLLKYGFYRRGDIYTVAPYVSVGLGAAMYNKASTFRYTSKGDGHAKFNTAYPLISAKDGGMAAAMYVPFGLGVKLRLTGNWQIRFACQYDLYVLGKDKMVDLYGATYTEKDDIVLKKSDWDDEKVNAEKEKLNFEGRPTYDNLKNAYAGKSVIGNSHNVMLTFGVIFNFTQTYKGLIIEY